MPFPDFLIIGAPRCGTTWLSRSLRQHPAVWLPPEKELNYFNYAIVRGPFRRCRTLCTQFPLRACLRKRTGWLFTQPHRSKAAWTLRYVFGARSDEWYAKLFDGARGRIAGEATPTYAGLPRSTIARIHYRMPRAKILYLLRDPIDQMWSHFRFICALHGRSATVVPDEEAIRFFTGHIPQRSADYGGNLRRWREFYPDVRVFFFEDMVRDPRGFLTEIFRYLGVADAPGIALLPENARNAAPAFPMPPRVRAFLARLCHPGLRELSGSIGGYTTQWLREAESIIGAADNIAIPLR